MRRISEPLLHLKVVCVLWLALLAGCATQTQLQDVGQVVVAPKVHLPPPPTVVVVTQPKPAGYFQQSLLDYFNGSQPRPTK